MNRILEIEKLCGGLTTKEKNKINDFFAGLETRIELPPVGKNLLISHFVNAFEYYLDKGLSVDKIIKTINYEHLGDFYMNKSRMFYTLDNAAIIYPLSMRYGQMMMFRVSAEMKEDINPIILQLALDFTIKRFPTFSAIVKRGFFWHYLETTNNVINVEEETDIPCRPMSLVLRSKGSIRVLYYKKRISFELFHSISDGTGAITFLKALIAEYLTLMGKKISLDETVLDIDETVAEEELVNEFNNAKGSDDLSTFMDKKSLQLDGKLCDLNITKILHFKLNSKQLKNVSKGYGGTVTAYILAIMFLAARDSISKKKGVINIQVPVNMRKFNGSKTLRNYSMYFNASMQINDIKDKGELVKEIDKQLKEKGSEANMNQMMMTTKKLINTLAYVPMILKNPITQLIYSYFSNSIICLTLSNLGVIKTPKKMENEIDSFALDFPPGRPNRATASLATFKDNCILGIIKASRDDTFENRLYEYLLDDNLDIEVEGSVEYES